MISTLKKPVRRVLVYQIGSLGDTIVTIPAFKAVRRHWGEHAHITLLHNVVSGPMTTPDQVLDGLGLVNEFLPYYMSDRPARNFLQAAVLAMRLRIRQFDAVVYLAPSRRSSQSVRRDKFFFRICGIPLQIGLSEFQDEILYPLDEEGLPARVPHEAWFQLERLRRDGVEVDADLDLSKPFLRLPDSEIQNAKNWLATHRNYPERRLVAICPGTKMPAKSWPLERFIEIGRRLINENRFELLVIGGKAERLAGEQMIAAWATGINAAGDFSAIGSAALLRQCAFTVGLDTGTTHLAAAQGVPCVALYASRDNPGRWDPVGSGHIVLRRVVSCSGCRLEICNVDGHPCMQGITVESVWTSILQLDARIF